LFGAGARRGASAAIPFNTVQNEATSMLEIKYNIDKNDFSLPFDGILGILHIVKLERVAWLYVYWSSFCNASSSWTFMVK